MVKGTKYMNKKSITGIIAAVAVVIGIVSALSYSNTFPNQSSLNTPDEAVSITDDVETSTGTVNDTEGKNVTIGLSDGVGVSSGL